MLVGVAVALVIGIAAVVPGLVRGTTETFVVGWALLPAGTALVLALVQRWPQLSSSDRALLGFVVALVLAALPFVWGGRALAPLVVVVALLALTLAIAGWPERAPARTRARSSRLRPGAARPAAGATPVRPAQPAAAAGHATPRSDPTPIADGTRLLREHLRRVAEGGQSQR